MSSDGMGVHAIEQVLIGGDLSVLSPVDRMQYYKTLCDSIGLNPLSKPFEYIVLNKKLTLYAKRDCTDQLRKIHGVSITITSREKDGDCYTVSARAVDKTGRTDESTGIVTISNLQGESRSNAMMRAETKAKRRVTLSICGLGFLDETEISDIANSYSDSDFTRNKYSLEFKEGEEKNIEETLNHVYKVKEHIVCEKVGEAYSYCENLSKEKKMEIWSRLDENERNVLKAYKTKGEYYAELS